jgi:hypothetical protein
MVRSTKRDPKFAQSSLLWIGAVLMKNTLRTLGVKNSLTSSILMKLFV